MARYVVTAGYVTAETAVGAGRAHIDIPRGEYLPADVPGEQVDAFLAYGQISEVPEPAGVAGLEAPVATVLAKAGGKRATKATKAAKAAKAAADPGAGSPPPAEGGGGPAAPIVDESAAPADEDDEDLGDDGEPPAQDPAPESPAAPADEN